MQYIFTKKLKIVKKVIDFHFILNILVVSTKRGVSMTEFENGYGKLNALNRERFEAFLRLLQSVDPEKSPREVALELIGADADLREAEPPNDDD